jgi:hypothetical protein
VRARGGLACDVLVATAAAAHEQPSIRSLDGPQKFPAADLRLWHFRVRPARGDGYIAWASKSPELGNGPEDVPLGEVVYFLLDDSEEDALHCLQGVLLKATEEAQEKTTGPCHSDTPPSPTNGR